MNIEDLLLPPDIPPVEIWQLGTKLSQEIENCSIALIFCSEFRGTSKNTSHNLDYSAVRKELYSLSGDFTIGLIDLGDFISGTTPKDSYCALEEVLAYCLTKGVLPVLIGGGADLTLPLFTALNAQQKDLNITNISGTISLESPEKRISENNVLSRIFSSRDYTVKRYHHLGYQMHLNSAETIRLLKDIDFDMLRLADLMNSTEKAEPFLRKAHLVTVNCNAVESFADAFSVTPQVNGLNRREICAYMKETGLSENLKAVGIFNFNAENKNPLNAQLLAQMVWYLLEGISIRKTHPVSRSFETYWVLVGDEQYAFKRETFSNLWYFGESDEAEELIPCTKSDYEQAVQGLINPRFIRP